MLLVKLDTGFNIEVEFALAPFHKRFFALLIDLMLQAAYIYVGARILRMALGSSWSDEEWHVVLFLLPYICYHLVSEITMNGQSLGKKALNIKVMTVNGGEPSLSQYFLRWMFRIVDFPVLYILAATLGYFSFYSVLAIFAGLLCVIFTRKSQRIGDLIAGTMLIDLKNRTSWEDTVFTEVEASYQPLYPQVMQLSDRDINTLKTIIETVRKKNDFDLSMRIAERIKSKLKMESGQDSLDFLETLLKDYNYYATR